jgi:hypothetical protein
MRPPVRENRRENAIRRSHAFSSHSQREQADYQLSPYSHLILIAGLSLRDREYEKGERETEATVRAGANGSFRRASKRVSGTARTE